MIKIIVLGFKPEHGGEHAGQMWICQSVDQKVRAKAFWAYIWVLLAYFAVFRVYLGMSGLYRSFLGAIQRGWGPFTDLLVLH